MDICNDANSFNDYQFIINIKIRKEVFDIDHNHIYNLFNRAYGDTDIIIDSLLICSMLIILKFVYSFLKKKSKFSNFHCLILTIISILPLYFLLKEMIYLLMILLSFFNYLFLSTSLSDCFYIYCHLSLKISKLLSNIVVLVSSSVGLFFILKFYDRNYSKEDKFSKFSIIISLISLSLLFIFHYQNLIYIASDYILTHLID